ncbi:MAG: glycoside hydrolase family 127 protein, partial [Planctomycetales bacterium]
MGSATLKTTTIRYLCLLCLGASWAFAQEKSPKPAPLGYPISVVPINEVKLRDGFWANRLKTHTQVTIPHVLKTLKIDYADPLPSRSALALVRTLEGAAYCLMIEDDPKLRGMMEKISRNIGEKYRSGNRFFGSCPEAAVFLYFATGKDNEWLKESLNEYRRRKEEYFDLDGKPLREPEPHAYYGMAIISLYQATGDEFYKDLAQKFMDIRGVPATRQRLWPKFAAQHQPVDKMNEPGGHAGSFGWFAAALVDVGALTGDPKYRRAAERIWQNLVDTRMCVTGGCGAVSKWEGFGEPYAIGRGGYNETCAASGQVFYNYRLGMLTKDA